MNPSALWPRILGAMDLEQFRTEAEAARLGIDPDVALQLLQKLNPSQAIRALKVVGQNLDLQQPELNDPGILAAQVVNLLGEIE